jgi:hypothetical protein
MFDLHAAERERKDMQERREKTKNRGTSAFHCVVKGAILVLPRRVHELISGITTL